MEMRRVVVLGEALVDFVPWSELHGDRRLRFEGHPGGAPANVAVGLRRLGVPTQLITKIGDDPFGDSIHAALVSHGVDVSSVRQTKEARTGITFVTLSRDGDRSFQFFCDGSADQGILWDEVDPGWIRAASLFHFSTFTLAHEPARTATLRAAEEARRAGVIVSTDLNLRPAIWDADARAREAAHAAMDRSDIVKMNAEEAQFVFPEVAGSEKVLDEVVRQGARLAVITNGARGGWYATREAAERYAVVPAASCDTTGAGDAFMAALLSRVVASEWPSCLSLETLQGFFRFSSAAGAIATEKYGAMSAMPDEKAIVSRLGLHASGGRPIGSP